MFIRLITAAILSLAVMTAVAEEAQMHTLDKQQFAAYDTQVKADLQTSHYKEISPTDQETVLKTLERMENRWQKADADGKLNANDVVEMANDQEVISTILNHAAADSRLVCSREVPMGTLISKNVCRTIAQMKREQNDSQEALRLNQKTPQNLRGH